MPSPAAWLFAFVLTALVEVPIVVFATGKSALVGPAIDVAVGRRALLALFAQLVTHPLVWFVFPRIAGLTGYTATTLSELWAWLGEAVFYATVMPLGWRRAIGIAGVANGASFALGLVLGR